MEFSTVHDATRWMEAKQVSWKRERERERDSEKGRPRASPSVASLLPKDICNITVLPTAKIFTPFIRKNHLSKL